MKEQPSNLQQAEAVFGSSLSADSFSAQNQLPIAQDFIERLISDTFYQLEPPIYRFNVQCGGLTADRFQAFDLVVQCMLQHFVDLIPPGYFADDTFELSEHRIVDEDII